jgi:phosphatidate cytidylyltransferase
MRIQRTRSLVRPGVGAFPFRAFVPPCLLSYHARVLKYRLITGPLLIVLLLLIILLDNWLDGVRLTGAWQELFRGKQYPPRGLALFALALFIAAPLAAWELVNISRAQGIAAKTPLTAIAAMLGVALSYCIPIGTDTINTIAILSTGMVVVFVASLVTFSRNQNVQGVIAAAGAVMFAMVYIGLMLGFLLAIRREHSAWWIVGIVMTTKMCDSGAYFTGRAIGKHKLIVWLSPGKTWEGLAGGVVTSTLTGVLFAWLSQRFLSPPDHVPLVWGAIWGCIFGLVGQFGDLMKSLLKRGAGIKDSSSLLPGLGGVLDVLDSPLMVAPVAYWLATALPA